MPNQYTRQATEQVQNPNPIAAVLAILLFAAILGGLIWANIQIWSAIF